MCCGKVSKDHVILILSVNADRTKKRTFFMTGKSNVKSMPVQYSTNKKFWKTSDLFEAEL
jgi:hypothetical protein